MDYNYLVPANSKKQGLIFGFLTKVDLIILLVGISVSFVLLLLLPVTEIWAIIVTLLPIGSLIYLLFCTSRYGWGFKKFMAEANEGTGIKFPAWARVYVTYVLPVIMIVLFAAGYWSKFVG